MLAALAVGWFVIPASVDYHFTEHYVFSSPKQAATISLAVIVPKTGPYQTVENIHAVWNGTRGQISYPAVDVLKFQGKIGSGETQEATISYDVSLTQGPARWEAPVLDLQLQPQAGIESDQTVLVGQAAQIATGQTREDAYKLYAFTAAYLSWPQGTQIGANQSALTVYRSRTGGCGEFANLAVALLRADKIPA
jgi:transglutaminase-like putative cysteine protease